MVDNNIRFDVNLQVHVAPEVADTILKAAAEAGVDYGANLLTLHKAVVVLINAGNYNHFEGWSAGPLWDETTLLDLAVAKLAEHDLNPTVFENVYNPADFDSDDERQTFPLDRYFAVERASDGTYWSFGGSTPEELADTMDQSEVQPGRLVFVTDLLTGRDLEPGLKLTFA